MPYHRPYYSFSPRFSIGVGVVIGRPVPYPYVYGAPTYVYGAPYGYGSALPPRNSYGGLSFEITPDDADVYVDGTYVGRAGDFSAYYQPLTLVPGRHRVELEADDCAPLVFDVDILPGQVLPYRGALQPY